MIVYHWWFLNDGLEWYFVVSSWKYSVYIIKWVKSNLLNLMRLAVFGLVWITKKGRSTNLLSRKLITTISICHPRNPFNPLYLNYPKDYQRLTYQLKKSVNKLLSNVPYRNVWGMVIVRIEYKKKMWVLVRGLLLKRSEYRVIKIKRKMELF